MTVIEIKPVENCLDSVPTRDFFLSDDIDKETILRLGKLGKLEYFPHFARPFFRVTKKGAYIIRGVQGNRSFQVIFTDPSQSEGREILAAIEIHLEEGEAFYGNATGTGL